MHATTHLLLLAAVAAGPTLARRVHAQTPPWTAAAVAQAAAENAAMAALLQTERRAVACGLDRSDPAACAQVGLIQAVLADLAAHDQNRAAADALALYYQILGVEQQQTLLVAGDQLLDRLIRSAQRAEQLELTDGNAAVLRQRRLTLADQAAQAELGAVQLRIRLAELTGQMPEAMIATPLPGDELAHAAASGDASAAASGDLPTEAGPASGDAAGMVVADAGSQAAVAAALANRADLRAIHTLCRCMTADALPSARALLGVVQPGLGMAVAAASRTPLLALHGGAPSTDDLHCRRSQCQRLLELRQAQVRADVLRAVVAARLADRRLQLQRQVSELAQQTAQETQRAVELEQAAVGADLLAELDSLEARGQLLQRQVDAAVARVRLRQAQGTAAAY